MDNLLRVSNTNRNTYIRFETIENIEYELQYIINANCFYVDEQPEVEDKIKGFNLLFEFENMNKRKFENKTAKNRQAIKLTFLLPKSNIKKNKIKKLRNLLVKNILNKNFNLHLTYVERRGTARYLVIVICERKYYRKPIKYNVIAECDRYKNFKTNTFCKKDEEEAILLYKRGEIIKAREVQFFPKKERQFCLKNKDWKAYLNLLHRVYLNCLEHINVTARRKYCFNQIDLKTAENRYQEWKIYKYNKIIKEMNLRLDEIYDFIYSPACFYQNYEVNKMFEILFYTYKSRLSNKSIKVGKLSLRFDMNTYYKSFNDNIEKLLDVFINECYELKENIALNY